MDTRTPPDSESNCDLAMAIVVGDGIRATRWRCGAALLRPPIHLLGTLACSDRAPSHLFGAPHIRDGPIRKAIVLKQEYWFLARGLPTGCLQPRVVRVSVQATWKVFPFDRPARSERWGIERVPALGGHGCLCHGVV